MQADAASAGRANPSIVETGMKLVPIMWAVWGVSFVFMAAVSIFSARLGRNEEAQIYLAESSSRVKSEQDAIAERVSRIRPLKMTALGAGRIDDGDRGGILRTRHHAPLRNVGNIDSRSQTGSFAQVGLASALFGAARARHARPRGPACEVDCAGPTGRCAARTPMSQT